MPRADFLTLKPVRGFPLVEAAVGGILLAVGLSIALASGHPAGLFVAAAGAVFAISSTAILLISRQHTFDRAAGTWTTQGLRAQVRPLRDISAVQLIQGDWHSGSGQAQVFTYQFNLALTGGERVNVTKMANWSATFTLASEVAEFLNVPLLDTASQE